MSAAPATPSPFVLLARITAGVVRALNALTDEREADLRRAALDLRELAGALVELVESW